MNPPLSRRDWMKLMGAAGAGSLIAAGAAPVPPEAMPLPGGQLQPQVLPLTSTSGVFAPPRGRAFQKFSFDFPGPSVEFAGLRFSFLVFSRENAYALDAGKMAVGGLRAGVEPFIEQLAAPTATPGGGSASAAAGAMAAALGADACRFAELDPQEAGGYDVVVYVKRMPPRETVEAVRRGGARQVAALGRPFGQPSAAVQDLDERAALHRAHQHRASAGERDAVANGRMQGAAIAQREDGRRGRG